MIAIRRGRARRQGGVALTELAIATALACLVALWGANKLARDIDDAAAQASGVWLAEIRRALEQMMARHFDTLAAGQIPRDIRGLPAYTNPLVPRLDELKAQGHLPGGFPERSALGMRAVTRILRGSACPGEGCRLDALAYTMEPLLQRGSRAPDSMRIAGVVMASGGGSVSDDAPGRLRGANFQFPNPPVPEMGRLPVGTVAVWAGYDTAMHRRFVRLDDDRDPAFRANLSAAGTIAAGGALTTAGAITAGGSISAGGPISAGGTMSAGGRLQTGEYLGLGGIAVVGQSCAPAGLLARDARGGVLSCEDGLWTVPGGFGGAYSFNHELGCRDFSLTSTANPRTGACSCPPGFKSVVVAQGGSTYSLDGWTIGYVCIR